MRKGPDNPRAAVIDIGSNSIRFHIYKEGEDIKRLLFTTRLYEKMQEEQRINADAWERSLRSLEKVAEELEQENIEKVYAVATSAVREAVNANDFLAEVKAKTGLEVRVLSAAEEAYLSHLGACRSLNINPGDTLVFDLGGGSTEIIKGSGEWFSLPLGAVRLQEEVIAKTGEKDLFVQEVEEAKMELMFRSIEYALGNLPGAKHWERAFVGVGGTVTTLAAVYRELEEYDPVCVHGTCLSFPEVTSLYRFFCCQPLDKRKKITGLQPSRADIIIPGTAIVLSLMRYLGIDSFTVSEGDLMLGILYAAWEAQSEKQQ